MNFLSPLSLSLFGLAIPIIALYILKLRRRREPVSTLMFWEQLFRERQTTSLFQRLKHLLSLLLQLLFLALLVLAIARPQFAFITKSARQLIVIIDHSASMNAVLNPDPDNPSSETRLDSAKQQALGMVQGLRFIDEMSVISCHERPIIHAPFTGHQKTLRQAIESIQSTDIKTDLKPAVDLAYAVAQTKPNPEIIVFSDFQSVSEETLEKFQHSLPEETENATSENDSTEPDKIKLHLLRVGEDSDNVGITQFRVRKSIVNAFDYETLLSVVNASEEEKKFSVELYFNDGLFDVRPYTLAPGESKSEIFSNFAFEGGKLKAVLDIPDSLPTDNVAYATLPKRELISVLLVTEGNPFLEKALDVDDKLDLTVMTPAEYDATAANFQVVIFERYSPSTLGDGNYMFMYPPKSEDSSDTETGNPVVSWRIGEALETPIITDWDRTHPVLQHVHLENVQIGAAYQVTPPSTAQILARSFDSPVLFVDVSPKRKIVFSAINILESDLPLRIAFPVIIANTIQWFQQSDEIQENHLHTGEVLRYKTEAQSDTDSENNQEVNTDTPTEQPQKTVKVTGPGDQTWDVSVENDEILFDQTLHAGFYELSLSNESADETSEDENDETSEDDGETHLWAVNLASETESHIGMTDGIEDLLTESEILGGSAFFRYPPWIYLVFLAVILSVVEWFLYQRRRID